MATRSQRVIEGQELVFSISRWFNDESTFGGNAEQTLKLLLLGLRLRFIVSAEFAVTQT